MGRSIVNPDVDLTALSDGQRPLDDILSDAKETMELMGMYKRALGQLAKYGSAYIVLMFVVIGLVSRYILVLSGKYELYDFWILLLIWIGVSLYHGNYDIESSRVYFLRVRGGAFLPVGQGLLIFFWPFMDLNKEFVILREQKTRLEDEIELREVTEDDLRRIRKERKNTDNPLPSDASAHARSIITADIEVAYWVVNPALYIWAMPGEDKKERQETIIGWVKDHLQSKWNEDLLGENEVVGYKGSNVVEGLTRRVIDGKDINFEEIERGWGIFIHWITIHGTEISEERKILHSKVYAGQVEGQAIGRKMDEICRMSFKKKASEMSDDELKDLRSYYLALQAIDAIKSSDKMVFGIDAIVNAVDKILLRSQS